MNIGFIGSGNMSTALAKGFLESGTVDAQNLFVSDKSPECLKKWENFGVKTSIYNTDVCKASDVVIFAVKPNVLPIVLEEIKEFAKDKLLISIAAGVTLATIEKILGSDARVIRVMPNTPAQVGCGMSVLSPNKNVSDKDLSFARELFSKIGCECVLDEKYINAATALHGSSPAYVYMLIDAMADSGVKYGIPKNISLMLSAKAVEGAAKMILETDTHPQALKDAVCSPGGTTIAAVLELEKEGFSSAVSKAIDACVKKADEMSQK